MNTIQKSARVAGLLYLIYFVVEIASDVFGRSSLIVMGDAATTVGNLAAHEGLFRSGFVGDLLAGVLFFLAAWGLFIW